MIVGFILGILFAILGFSAIMAVNTGMDLGNTCTDWNPETDKTYLTNFGKINIVIATIIICLSTFVGARIHIRMFEYDVKQFESAKATYSEAIKSNDISGLERIEIVNKITEENKALARLKYEATKWYYFYLPDNIVDNLEPIKLN